MPNAHCFRLIWSRQFIPLVDVEKNGDGTMLWPRSHLEGTRYDAYRAAIARSGSLEEDEIAMGEMEAPACPKGSLLIFDFRLLHRGMPNDTGRDRAIAHAILGTGFARDQLNSQSSPSLWDAVASSPKDPEDRRAWQEAFLKRQDEAWRVTRESSAR